MDIEHDFVHFAVIYFGMKGTFFQIAHRYLIYMLFRNVMDMLTLVYTTKLFFVKRLTKGGLLQPPFWIFSNEPPINFGIIIDRYLSPLCTHIKISTIGQDVIKYGGI